MKFHSKDVVWIHGGVIEVIGLEPDQTVRGYPKRMVYRCRGVFNPTYDIGYDKDYLERDGRLLDSKLERILLGLPHEQI